MNRDIYKNPSCTWNSSKGFRKKTVNMRYSYKSLLYSPSGSRSIHNYNRVNKYKIDKTAENKLFVRKNSTFTHPSISKEIVKRSKYLLTNKIKSNINKKTESLRPNECLFFKKYGKCIKLSTCPFLHVDETSLKRLNIKYNPYKFVFINSKPICKHFLAGKCHNTNASCQYLHVKYNPNQLICLAFIQGKCQFGAKCPKQHSLECPEFMKNHKCPTRNSCPFMHPVGKQISTVYHKPNATSLSYEKNSFSLHRPIQSSITILDAANYKTKAQALAEKIKHELIKSQNLLNSTLAKSSPIKLSDKKVLANATKNKFPYLPTIINLKNYSSEITSDPEDNIMENDSELKRLKEKYKLMDVWSVL